jgi:hypothetical protein
MPTPVKGSLEADARSEFNEPQRHRVLRELEKGRDEIEFLASREGKQTDSY